MEGMFPRLESRIDLLRLFELDIEKVERIEFSMIVPGQTVVHVGQDKGNYIVVLRKSSKSLRGKVVVGYDSHKKGAEITARVNLEFDAFYIVKDGCSFG